MFYIVKNNTEMIPLLKDDKLNEKVYNATLTSNMRYFNSLLAKLSNMSGKLLEPQRKFVETALAFNFVNKIKFVYNKDLPFTFTDEEIIKVRQAVSLFGYILASKVYESSSAIFDVNEVRDYAGQIFRRRISYLLDGFGTETELLDFLVTDKNTWFYLEENENLHRSLIELDLVVIG